MADRHTDRASAARLTWTTSGDRATISVSGDIDRADARRLVDLAAAALSSASSLDLDLQDVGVFGSAASDAIARVRMLCARSGAAVRLVNKPPHVTRVLEVLDFDPAPPVPDPTQDGRLLITSSSFEHVIAQGVLQGRESVMVTTTDMDLPGPRIVFVNRAFTDLTGYAADETIGQTPRILQGPLTDRETLDRLVTDVRAGRSFSGETINYRKDGSPFAINWRVVAVDGERGQPGYLLAMQSDVTELRRLARFETALTYLDSRSSCSTSSAPARRDRDRHLLDALLAAEVSLMGGGDAIGRLTRRNGRVVTAATSSDLLVAQSERIARSTAAPLVADEPPTMLHIPIRFQPNAPFLDGGITLTGMHRDRLALADVGLHERLAARAGEQLL